MIKLVHVITSMDRGGAQSMLQRLVDELEKMGEYHQEIIILTGKNEYKLHSNITIHYLNTEINKSLIAKLIEFRALIKSIAPEIIQSWMYHANFLAFFSGISRENIVFNIRHSLHDIKNEKQLTRILIKICSFMSRYVFKTVYCSKVSMKQHYKAGYSESKSIFIPNGFDVRKFAPNHKYRRDYRERMSIEPKTFVFGSIARFHPMKNHLGLIKDFSLIQGNCSLVLIGEGVVNEEIKQLVQNLKLENRVVLLEKKEDINKWLSAIDSIIIPSLWGEAFPNILGEAMSTEIPCIVSQVGDAPLILGDCGLVIEDSIHKSMQYMHNLSASDRNNLGRMARNRIIAKYSLSNSSKMYSDLYKDLILI